MHLNRIALAALALLSATTQAAPSAPPIEAGSHISVYYSTLDVEASYEGNSGSIDGNGYGLQMWLGNGIGLFTAEFEAAKLDGNVLGTAVDADAQNVRVGMGYRFIHTSTAGLWLRAEYVNFDGDIEAEGVGRADDSQDGYGIHAGGSVGNGLLNGYAELGTLQLSDLDGLEYKIGVGIQPGLVGAFVEYRVSDLETDNLGIDEKYKDLRIGVRVAFQ